MPDSRPTHTGRHGGIDRAVELHRRGVAENNAGRPMAAMALFRRAASEVARDIDQTDPVKNAPDVAVADASMASASEAGASVASRFAARLAISMAMGESEMNGLERGLLAIAPAQRYVEATGDPEIQVLLELQLGYMRVRGGYFIEGLQHLDQAMALFEHAEPLHRCNILMNRGMVHLYLGRLERARADFTDAVREAQRSGRLVEEVKATHNLGCLEGLAGNLALALKIMDANAALEADVSQAVILSDRSRVLIEAGLHREADDALVRAGELFRKDRLWKDVGEVELARAECALLDGEIAAARRLAASARTRFRRRGNDRWRRDAELVLLQADLAAGRPGSRLTPPALRLAAEFRGDGLSTRARTAQLIAAEALLSARRTVEAREIAASAGPVRPADPISARLHTRLVRAKLQLATGNRPDGKREIRTGLTELARHQARFGSIDLQTASAVHGRELVELDLTLALADGNPAAVLASVEQGRAISSRLPAVVAPQDPAAAEWLSELRQLTEQLRTIESDPAATKRVASQRRRVAEVQQTLRSRAWQSEGSGQARKPATLAETVAALEPNDAVFVCFIEANGQLHALVLGSGRGRRRGRVGARSAATGVVVLCSADHANELVRRLRADLDVLANGHLPAALITAVGSSLRRTLAALDELLIQPLGLGDLRLVISPTGTLATLPWGLLPSLVGCPIVVAPSATAWLSASELGPAPSPAGTPSSANSRDRAAAAQQIAVFAGPDLAFATEEAKAIAALWASDLSEVPGSPFGAVQLDAVPFDAVPFDAVPFDAVLFDGPEARQDDLRAAMTAATVVHVAAHGQHQAENPLFSSLRLADGPVFAYEFDQTAQAAQHVVLSSCELGQATVRPGDEALGWTSVLLHLGTRSVVSGVSRVHDEVAAAAMVKYHRLLAAGTDSAAALAQAISDTDGLPAPFVCFGASWRARRFG
ncbi:CHAT domain-containing protein [Jatrophihabitans sp. DSM 45814]